MEAGNPRDDLPTPEDPPIKEGAESRRASFPPSVIFRTQIPDNEPRSCSANAAAAPHLQELDEHTDRPIEARAAFEDVTPSNTNAVAILDERGQESNEDDMNTWLAEMPPRGGSSLDKDGSATRAFPTQKASDLPTTDEGRRSFSAPPPEVSHLYQDKGPHYLETEVDSVGIRGQNDRERFQIAPVIVMGSEEPVLLTEVGRSSDECNKKELSADDQGATCSRSQDSLRVCTSTAATVSSNFNTPAVLQNAAQQIVATTSNAETANRREFSVKCGDGILPADDVQDSDSVDTDQFEETTESTVFPSSRETTIEAGQTKTGTMTFCEVARSLTRWKMATMRADKQRNETIAKDPSHQQFMKQTADRIKTQLPRPLRDSILEEAYPILVRTAQAYKSQLGSKHKLTVQAYERLDELTEDLKTRLQ